MNENTNMIIEDAVDAIFEPKRRRWSIQGFGMLRCYLQDDVRLHLWDPEQAWTQTIHDHPWDFTSLVVAGRLTDACYGMVPLLRHGRATHHATEIVCGPGGGMFEKLPDVCLQEMQRKTYRSGEKYAREANDLHVTLDVEPGTVSIITRRRGGKHPDRARVFYPIGTEWTSAEPRPATPREIEQFTRLAREKIAATLAPK